MYEAAKQSSEERAVLEAMDGAIWVESTGVASEGATFFIAHFLIYSHNIGHVHLTLRMTYATIASVENSINVSQEE
ncbi:MAG: hypothetical protein NVS4B12_02550 [Ktedonobacteraceae bacterium]